MNLHKRGFQLSCISRLTPSAVVLLKHGTRSIFALLFAEEFKDG